MIDSFEDVFGRERVRMVQLAFLMVGCEQRAEEIVQDAFAQLFERWDGVQRPGAYLRTCVVNGCRRTHRRRDLERRASLGDSQVAAVEFAADHMADALAAIPAKRRAALVLRYYDELSVAEIAEVLGVPGGTGKSMLNRGLTQLREVIER